MALKALTLFNRLLSRGRLRHMQALVALNDLRSMGRAAQAMGMSQPAMSQLVTELERLIETPLFLRHSKGVDPTPAARELLPVALRILAATEEGAERIATQLSQDGGMVRVATTSTASGGLLSRVLPRFARDHPGIQVQVSTVIGQSLDGSFVGDEFDLICCRVREVVPEGWTFCPCTMDHLVVVGGAQHPLTRKPEVSRDELSQAWWLRNHVSSISRRYFDALAEREGWNRLHEVQMVSMVPELVWSMLKEGTMISLVPQSVFEPWLAEGQLKVVQCGLELKLPPVGFHWKPRHANSATRLLTEALSSVADGFSSDRVE